jgi:hypothetical protein
MGFIDWTLATNNGGTASLDTTNKHAGTSSAMLYVSSKGLSPLAFVTFSRNDLVRQNVCVILWARARSVRVTGSANASAYAEIGHPSYGFLTLLTASINSIAEWAKFRVWFWYDAIAGSRIGRVEEWINDAWVQQGSDTYFGTGESVPDTIVLRLEEGNDVYASYGEAWYDELEVYEVTV